MISRRCEIFPAREASAPGMRGVAQDRERPHRISWNADLTFGRLRPLHTNAVIFAFCGNIIFAGTYHSIRRLLKTRLFSDTLSAIHFYGWQLPIVESHRHCGIFRIGYPRLRLGADAARRCPADGPGARRVSGLSLLIAR